MTTTNHVDLQSLYIQRKYGMPPGWEWCDLETLDRNRPGLGAIVKGAVTQYALDITNEPLAILICPIHGEAIGADCQPAALPCPGDLVAVVSTRQGSHAERWAADHPDWRERWGATCLP